MISGNYNADRGLYTIDQKVEVKAYKSPFPDEQKANDLLAIASNKAEAISAKLPEIYGVIAEKYRDNSREIFREVLQQTLNKNLQQPLEEKIEQLQGKDLFKDYFKKELEDYFKGKEKIKDENTTREFIKGLINKTAATSIEVLVTTALDGGVPYEHFNRSGEFNEAFTSLIPKFRQSFGYTHQDTVITNTRINIALYLLVHEGYAVEGNKIEKSTTEQKEEGKNRIPALVITSKIDPYLNGAEGYYNKSEEHQNHQSGNNGSGNGQKANNHHLLQELGEKLHLVGHH